MYYIVNQTILELWNIISYHFIVYPILLYLNKSCWNHTPTPLKEWDGSSDCDFFIKIQRIHLKRECHIRLILLSFSHF